jgi:hypothetical protein
VSQIRLSRDDLINFGVLGSRSNSVSTDHTSKGCRYGRTVATASTFAGIRAKSFAVAADCSMGSSGQTSSKNLVPSLGQYFVEGVTSSSESFSRTKYRRELPSRCSTYNIVGRSKSASTTHVIKGEVTIHLLRSNPHYHAHFGEPPLSFRR